MSSKVNMSTRVEEYLAMRRAVGFSLSIAGQQLKSFAKFVDDTSASHSLTLELSLRWARASNGSSPVGPARRLEVIRPFARFLSAIDPDTEIPPRGVIGPSRRRLAPHIYSDKELHDLLATAKELRPEQGLRPETVRCYLGLLAATGMRPGEPLVLSRDDVDFVDNTITIQRTKFSKSRVIVVDSSTTRALRNYARRRSEHTDGSSDPSFFLIDAGLPLTIRKAHTAFRRLRAKLGWKPAPGRLGPRLYDLRHTFVCRRILKWYRDGVDLHAAIPLLSTYLGHVKITDTYWYVTGIPELMDAASSRFESFASGDEGGQ